MNTKEGEGSGLEPPFQRMHFLSLGCLPSSPSARHAGSRQMEGGGEVQGAHPPARPLCHPSFPTPLPVPAVNETVGFAAHHPISGRENLDEG